ncbi:AfsR/SARP family transcriptional regulator [Saccharopolyspora sp. 5N708]|uniref:AfsR/SARP family transcriptional regulator n=1 Tax=Saccharopolyspora sp. 5N708 TaxID=3457424 RepID=UPI003FD1237C
MSLARIREEQAENYYGDRKRALDIGVLGPLSLRFGGEVNTPSAPKLRNVLTTLIVSAGQVVPVSMLMRELWDEEPPQSWLTTLQTYILNLRKLLASFTGTATSEIAGTMLQTRAGGYVFQLGSGTLDLREYQTMVSAGREQLAAGDDLSAVRTFDAALRLWRGPAFVDVQGGRVLESKRRQIEESRLVVLEHLIGAQLRLGMYHEVLTELVGLTVENPLHEGLHAQYMLALYSLGRRAEALEVYRRLRNSLIEELGLEPGSQAREVHQAILDSDGAQVLVPQQRRFGDAGWSDPTRLY